MITACVQATSGPSITLWIGIFGIAKPKKPVVQLNGRRADYREIEKLRPDMLPAFRSEAILVKLKGNSLRNSEATHVPLAQPEGPTYSPAENGVVSRPLEDFRDAERYPNIALIALPVAQEKIFRHIDAFKRSRSSLDALEQVVRWLAYCWGVDHTPNPLHENYAPPRLACSRRCVRPGSTTSPPDLNCERRVRKR